MKIIAAIIAILSLSISGGCTTAPKDKIIVQTIQVETPIKKMPLPRAMHLEDPEFVVITENNFEEVKARFTSGKFIMYAVTPSNYKKLIRNQAELKRYISQQKSIIIYYEKIADAK